MFRSQTIKGQYAREVMRDRPAAYWRLGDAMTQASDYSGNNNVLDYSGSYLLGQAGAIVAENDGAAKFSGGGATSSAAVTAAVDNITSECWLKATDATITTGNRCVMFLGSPGGAGFGLYLFTGSATMLAGGVASFGFGYTPPVGAWVHLALVRASGTWTFYVNGKATGGTTASTPNSPSAHTLLAVNDLGTEALNASLDEAAIYYTTALTPGRIAAHYRAGFGSLGPRRMVPASIAASFGTCGSLGIGIGIGI